VVVAGKPDGQPVLRTESGTFVFTSERALPIDSQLTLKVLNVGSSILAALLSQDEEAIHPPAQIRLTLTNLRAAPAHPESDVRLVPGVTVTGAIVGEAGAARGPVASTPASAFPTAAKGALATGTHLTFRLIRSTPAPADISQPASGARDSAGPPRAVAGQTTAAPTGTAVAGGATAPATGLPPEGTTTPANARPLADPTARQAEKVVAASASVGAKGAPPGPAAPSGENAAGGAAPGPVGSGASTANVNPAPPSGAATAGHAPPESRANVAPAADAAVRRPHAAPTSAPPGPNAVQFTALVAGHDQDGLLLIETPAGMVRLDTTEPLAAGTRLHLEVTGSATSYPGHAIAPQAETGAVASVLKDWPALREALQALHNASPAAAANFSANVVPAPTPQLSANLLFFLVALRFGDLAGWLGRDTTQTLQRAGRDGLIRRLSDDFVQLGQISERPTSADWRTYAMPFHDGRQLQQIRVLTRRHSQEGDDEADTGTRFVVDLALSRFGAFQLDGLMHGKHLQLIVRSHAPLDDAVHRDISAIFYDSVAASGLSGNVTFRAEPTFSVSAAGDAGQAASSEAGLVV
jgi:hypothetical protein